MRLTLRGVRPAGAVVLMRNLLDSTLLRGAMKLQLPLPYHQPPQVCAHVGFIDDALCVARW